MSYYDNIIESLVLLVVGMTGVLLSLAFLALVIWTMKVVDEKLNARKISKYATKVDTQPSDIGVNDEIVAIITAAAMAEIKKAITVKRIHFIDPNVGSSWASSGRSHMMASRKF